MDKLVYTAATGLRAHMAAQAAIANNMANGSTTGFRADRVVFDRIELKGGGAQIAARMPSAEEVTDADRTAGAIQQTGRPLDVAVSGDAWIAVQAADGQEAYTRRGDLEIAPSGVLQTGDGHIVMGQSGPITLPPASSVSIGADGSITIVPQGADATQTQIVDKLKLASAKGTDTVKGLDNLLYVRGGGTLPEDLDARVQGGALEGSNVNMTQALVDMIENQRSYEVTANLMKSTKDMDESSTSLLRLPS
ncbi:flagellar basal-body rod protein FlgF [Sphingomonas sp. SORGH_AS802]|uniref:flagellar basal body rod protein FlgF n=1 Tax=unclassified Sphingomonas TaxID=196159 RepID=UPI00286042CC|nr:MULTISPECIES: flagellar basal body rod protein FlgF [unclassified Sphingomonas]MDR6128290.1 flagellar basal-body rod protein FlgF [Sphingomonas sp. SORGH_AS_0438]MDR6135506.1 flagellar basal-body rod protein FlgF [Sphingomonas sp. SORGH_AS_0802]